tara:strand:+ start:896 stop:1522 length:627 start_codon:yes stop_codon:yes gene_type:complete
MSSVDITTVSKVYKSRKILLEQLEERGFDVSEYNDFSINQIATMIEYNQLDLLLVNKNSSKIFVKHQLFKPLRQNNLSDLVDDIFYTEKILSSKDELLIITKDEPNQTILDSLSVNWKKSNIYINVTAITRLLFDITKHKQVPRHIVLSEMQKKDIIEKYNISDVTQFPEISRFDPVAIAIGLRPDDLCLIERPSKTAITTNYYRYCI